jgi:epoxyqueuosine reductase
MCIAEKIKTKAIELGFDLVGLTDAGAIDSRQVEYFEQWLRKGFAGEMSYMHWNLDKRINPTGLLENARSVIVTGLNYNRPGFAPQRKAGSGRVASYACYQDYHQFIRKRLYKLVDFISSLTDEDLRFKVCVDSAPIAERALAQRAGLGFIGKNRMLINPNLGCKIFLGEIITTIELPPDKSISAECSNCDQCIKACPTGAIRQDGWFDASKCINYLTIEYKGQIPSELADKIDDKLIGCEDCINACPYQKHAPLCRNEEFKFHPEREFLNLTDILGLNEDLFNERFVNSPIKRSCLEGLKRNAKICLAKKNIYPSVQ